MTLAIALLFPPGIMGGSVVVTSRLLRENGLPFELESGAGFIGLE